MLYFLYGADRSGTILKIRELKEAFQKKNAGYLIEDYGGDELNWSIGEFRSALGQGNLFAKVRLVIFRDVLSEEKFLEELEDSSGSLKDSKDILLFWETDPDKKTLAFFKKNAARTQEFKIKEKKAEEIAPSAFAFVDKMFGARALLALKEMSLAGLEPQKFIYAFLWKLKQKSAQGGPASGWPDAYFAGILAESQMRRDPKNAEEILEQFIYSIH